jgi:hypothetical protein
MLHLSNAQAIVSLPQLAAQLGTTPEEVLKAATRLASVHRVQLATDKNQVRILLRQPGA